MPLIKKRTDNLQQKTLGFFDVPESANVAVQRKAKRKKSDAALQKNAKNRREESPVRENTKPSDSLSEQDESSPPEAAARAEKMPEDAVGSRTQRKAADASQTLSESSEGLSEKSKAVVPTLSSRNIALQLQQRSLGVSRMIKPHKIPWSTAPWLKLQCPLSGAPLQRACILEWDPMGVLLAAMTRDDSILRIYDWDTVSAVDAKGRNRRARRKTKPNSDHAGEAYRIDSALHINVYIRGMNVRKLVWNPFDVDQIAILDGNLLYIFDLGKEAARQQQGRGGSAKPMKVDLSLPRNFLMNIMFVAADTMIVSSADRIVCVTLRNSCRRIGGVIAPSQLWSMTWKENTVSSIVSLGSGLVALGSTKGCLSVIHWQKTQKATFAAAPQPMILSSWFSGSSIRHPGSQHMGIHHLGVEQILERSHSFGSVIISWVTTCGWAMSTCIDLKDGQPLKPTKVLQRTTPVRCMNQRNEYIDIGKKTWSLPSKNLCVGSTDQYICWERVPDIVQVLPDHDKFVLSDRPRIVSIAEHPSLNLIDRKTAQTYSVHLGKGAKQVISVAVHMSMEWILVSTVEDGVRFYSCRIKS